MGPEIENTALELRNSWVIEMAGVYHHNGTVDDNDGIYLHRQSAGQTIHLSGGVIANVQDDGIDTLGARALIEDYYVSGRDDLADKAISVFDGEVTIEHCLLTDTDIGVETKGAGNSTPRTTYQPHDDRQYSSGHQRTRQGHTGPQRRDHVQHQQQYHSRAGRRRSGTHRLRPRRPAHQLLVARRTLGLSGQRHGKPACATAVRRCGDS